MNWFDFTIASTVGGILSAVVMHFVPISFMVHPTLYLMLYMALFIAGTMFALIQLRKFH